MNFIERTNQLIKEEFDENESKNILIVGAEYRPDAMFLNTNIIVPEKGYELSEWISDYRNSENCELFDTVILSRVLEHIQPRDADWILYQLYTIMKENAKLIVIVPDMIEVTKQLIEEENKNNPDEYKILRLNLELFSEGEDVFDRHAFFTTKKSVIRMLEKEKLFKVNMDEIDLIDIDSSLVPSDLFIPSYRV